MNLMRIILLLAYVLAIIRSTASFSRENGSELSSLSGAFGAPHAHDTVSNSKIYRRFRKGRQFASSSTFSILFIL